MLDLLAQGLLTYLLHSSLMLGAVLLARRALQRQGLLEAAGRAALLGAWLSTAWACWPQERVKRPAPIPAAALPMPSPAATPQALPAPPTPAAAPTPPSANARAALQGLALLWLAGAVLLALRLLAQRLELARQLRRLPRCEDEDLEQQAKAWASGERRQAARLLRSRGGSPWAWQPLLGRACIALPDWLWDDLGAAERRAVLAHELAHLQRRDPQWRTLMLWAALLGWLQPLNRLLMRELEACMETACDAAAAPAEPEREALATSLMRAAEHLQLHPHLVSAMLGRPTPRRCPLVLTRLRHLLEPSSMPMPSLPSRPVVFSLWLAFALMAFALPAALLPGGASLGERFESWSDELGAGFSSRLSWRGGHTLVRTDGPDGRIELRWGGSVQFSDDDREVLAVSGPLRFLQDGAGLRREWRMGPEQASSYRVNGQDQALDTAGREWLAAMTRLAAESTQAPAERLPRLMAQGGLPAALAYIDRTASDHSRRLRIEALLGLLPDQARDAPLALKLLALSAKLDSDHESRLVLAAIGRQTAPDTAGWQTLLQQAAGLGGDFDRAQLFTELAPRVPLEVRDAWRAALQGIDSDFERRRALEAQLAQGQGDWRADVLAASRGMGSAFEQSSLFEALAARLRADDAPALWQAIAEATRRIDSDFHRRVALGALVKAGPRQPEVLQALLTALGGMENSHERLQLLRAIAPLLPASGELDAAYRLQARGLGSHERGEAEQALDR